MSQYFKSFTKKGIIDHRGTFQASILTNVLSREVVSAMISSFK